jgi:hypothetical protein
MSLTPLTSMNLRSLISSHVVAWTEESAGSARLNRKVRRVCLPSNCDNAASATKMFTNRSFSDRLIHVAIRSSSMDIEPFHDSVNSGTGLGSHLRIIGRRAFHDLLGDFAEASRRLNLPHRLIVLNDQASVDAAAWCSSRTGYSSVAILDALNVKSFVVSG